MKLLIVRHGQTDWNVEGRIQGRTDIKLNETGIKQAQEVARKLQNIPIDVIFCSPMTRARQTVKEIVNNRKQVPVYYDERLIEQCFGEEEGKYRKDIFSALRIKTSTDGRETMQEVYDRVIPLIQEIEKNYSNKTVLVVTHGGVIVPITFYVKGMTKIEEGMGIPIIENCAILEYER